MKIAVLTSKQNIASAKKIIDACAGEGLPVRGLRFSDTWQNEQKKRLDSFFSDVEYILCIADHSDMASTWFTYAAGYADGKSVQFSLYRVETTLPLPAWLGDTLFFNCFEDAMKHITEKKLEWDEQTRRQTAKAALLEMGISWHADSMAQCVKDGDTRSIELFITSGYPPDVRDKQGVPMVCLAARTGNAHIVESLLDSRADINIRSDDRGYTALMDAAMRADEKLLGLLLKRGADPNIVGKDGQNALILAVGRNDSRAVKKLLEHGADPDMKDRLGLSARQYAQLFHDPAVNAAMCAEK